jgi:FAD/FMN-containing dehydrogenase
MSLLTDPRDGLDDLALDLDGRLVRPSDAGWDAARTAWHLDVDQRPTAVAQVASVRDVVAVVDAAGALGLRVAAQSTGHNAAPLGDLTGTILVRTGAMRAVEIDPDRRIARVEAGAWWADVTTAAAEHGLAALAGSSHDVGVTGYVLGGGVSWLARSHGLAANTVTALEVVTADGRLRRVDDEHDADLFWALRGGGGDFAVVTHLELQLFPIASVVAGVLFFPVDRAEEVLQAWRRWLPSVPDEVTSVGRILNFPPLPDLPPHLAGHSFAVVEVACLLAEAEVDALLAPLRALGPAIDTVHVTPMTELSLLHMDPPGPVPGVGDGRLLDEVGEDGIAAFVTATRAAGPALLSAELRQLRGAVGRRPEGGGAVASLDADLLLFAVGITPVPEAVPMVRAAVAAVHAAVRPWWTGGSYLNFAEEPRTAEELFGSETAARLKAVKAAVDPAGTIRSNHPVG